MRVPISCIPSHFPCLALPQLIDWQAWILDVPSASPAVNPFTEVAAHPCGARQPALLKGQTPGIDVYKRGYFVAEPTKKIHKSFKKKIKQKQKEKSQRAAWEQLCLHGRMNGHRCSPCWSLFGDTRDRNIPPGTQGIRLRPA